MPQIIPRRQTSKPIVLAQARVYPHLDTAQGKGINSPDQKDKDRGPGGEGAIPSYWVS